MWLSARHEEIIATYSFLPNKFTFSRPLLGAYIHLIDGLNIFLHETIFVTFDDELLT